MSLFNELKRRNVFRVGAAFVVAAWLVIQVVETIFPVYGLSDASIRMMITLLAVGLVMAYHALGETKASDTALEELISKYEQRWAYNIAFVLAYRNEAGRAFEWLKKAVQYDDLGLSEILAEPAFAHIHSDPRWLPFLESIGYAPSQLDAIEFNVTLPLNQN